MPARRRADRTAFRSESRSGSALARWTVGLLAVVAPVGARAQPLEAETPEVGGLTEPTTASVGLSLTVGRIDEDWYLRTALIALITTPPLTLASESLLFDAPVSAPVRLSVWAPGNILLHDAEPDDESWFRTEDWDEPGEFVRTLRWVEYGTPYSGVYVRLGELANASIGHRTIVDGYVNTLDLNHFQWGVQNGVNTVYGGAEWMLDHVLAPEVGGLRLYVRPWSFVDPESVWRRLAIGWTLAGDLSAPARMATDEEGRYLTDGDALVVEDSDPVGVHGGDIEMQVVQTDRFQLTPYTDVNHHLGRGVGWHLGSFAGVQPLDWLVLDLRGEFRWCGANYLPSYVGSLYEVERYAYLPSGNGEFRLPKLQWLRAGEQEGRVGYLGQLGLNVGNLVQVSGAYEDYQGPSNSSLWLRASMLALDRVQFGAYYASSAFDGLGNAFDPNRALLVGEARWMVNGWFYVAGQVARRWLVTSEGRYEPADDFAFGAGVSVGLGR